MGFTITPTTLTDFFTRTIREMQWLPGDAPPYTFNTLPNKGSRLKDLWQSESIEDAIVVSRIENIYEGIGVYNAATSEHM